MKLSLLLLTVPSLAVVLAGCAPHSEDDVVVYSTVDEEFASPIFAAFERSVDHEIAVDGKFHHGSAESGSFERVLADEELAGGDVVWNEEILQTVRLQKLGLLQRHDWPVPPDWPRDLIASDSTWCGFAARARVLLINTNLLDDPVKYPSSVAELMDPKWAGQCAMASPLSGTTATHWAVLRERLGREDAMRQLTSIADNALILPSNQQVAQAVSAGRVAWGLTDSDHAMVEKERGSPVAIVFPDQQPDQPGTLRIPNTLAILKSPSHPVAASLLVNYLMTPETEDRLAMGPSSQIPISKASQFPPPVLPESTPRWMRVNFESVSDGWQYWAADVAKVFAEDRNGSSPADQAD